MAHNLLLPLSREQIIKLKRGYDINAHWHDIPNQGDLLVAIVGQFIIREKYQKLLESGATIISVPVTFERLQMLRQQCVEATYPNEITLTIFDAEAPEAKTLMELKPKKLEPNERKEGE